MLATSKMSIYAGSLIHDEAHYYLSGVDMILKEEIHLQGKERQKKLKRGLKKRAFYLLNNFEFKK